MSRIKLPQLLSAQRRLLPCVEAHLGAGFKMTLLGFLYRGSLSQHRARLPGRLCYSFCLCTETLDPSLSRVSDRVVAHTLYLEGPMFGLMFCLCHLETLCDI